MVAGDVSTLKRACSLLYTELLFITQCCAFASRNLRNQARWQACTTEGSWEFMHDVELVFCVVVKSSRSAVGVCFDYFF